MENNTPMERDRIEAPFLLSRSHQPELDSFWFEAARSIVLAHTERVGGIGTLGEKALHAIIKHYLAPDIACHEQKIGRYVVDILKEDRVIEIQSRQFGKLRSKLDALLPDYPVTIVLPIAARKWLLWVDPDSGEISQPRLSPRRGSLQDAFPELVRIKPYLAHPNLSVLLLLIDLEEYRLLNGWSQDRKRGSWRQDRLPVGLADLIWIETLKDYGQFFPAGLPDAFTSADYATAASIRRNRAQIALNVLKTLDVVTACGKKGRLILYQRTGLAETN